MMNPSVFKKILVFSDALILADLLPEHFRFVRGVVDSPDLSLNISRELLQHDRQLKVIAANLEKKIKSELAKMLKDDREAYETFWKNFGRQLKYGAVGEYGAHKELLQDLLLFYSSTEKKLVTLGDAVKEVKASARLKSHPVCLTAGEGLSFEMEKYFQAVQPDSAIKAERILELNVDHPAFQALEQAVTADPEKAKKYAQLLYDQALLIAGLPLDDPSGYTDLVCELMK